MNSADSIHTGFAGAGAAGTGSSPVEEVPAPWNLNGSGLIIIMRSRLDKLAGDARIPEKLRASLKTPLSVLMYVNYTHSNAGPYQELLYIPGTVAFTGRRLPTISNIVVSSVSSVVNGRRNWGIPKNLCSFGNHDGPEGLREISLESNGLPQFQLAYRGKGFSFPITTGLVPRFLKTLGQHWEGSEFVYSPSASGRARFASIHQLESLGDSFPDIDLKDVLFALEITRFNMVFPVPQILQAGPRLKG
ncbi:MAG TPA: hypothetical protein VFV28_00505 [Limnobacter sp.]|nr:hypothetical protein [Limnobacter sp.]